MLISGSYQINILAQEKLNIYFFDKSSICDSIPLRLPTSCAISSRGPKTGSNDLNELEKKKILPLFLHKLKIKLLASEDELTFF